jgi:LuxR family maltose regulon positive regulatory protein
LALIQQAQSRHAAARASLQEAGQQMERPDCTPGARLHYLTQQIRVSLAQGDLERAVAVARQAPEPSQAGSFPGYLYLSLALVRLLLAQQQQVAAWERLSAVYETVLRAGWQSLVVQVRAFQALAAPNPDKALSLLGEALALAEPEGYLRTFLDLGEPMRKLLVQIRSVMQGSALAYVGTLLSAFEARPEPAALASETPSLSVQPLIEPLSEREREVLSLLAEDQLRTEIARELVVSVNTIKAHLKGIYGKLGVHDRRAAVERAHELGLI